MNLESYLNTQVELISKSSAIHSEAVSDLLSQGLVSIQALQAGDRIAAIRQNLTASVGKNDYSITVSYNSPKPDEAAYVVNAVVDAYTKFTIGDQHKKSETTLEDVKSD